MNALPGGVLDKKVLDFCTGSGVVAIAAAGSGAAAVTAVDLCSNAARCAQDNADAAGLDVDVLVGSFPEALAAGPYDVVLCNPPYVPAPSIEDQVTPLTGPTQAWDASVDGRLVLDPLCAIAPDLLADNGTLLVVQSEYSGTAQTVDALRRAGMDARVIAEQRVEFGPVMKSRATWLWEKGLMDEGCHEETLVVILATKR
ncbi:MAG: methyltransferase [Williamsia sp.]|nr:methyltransferase [Williamsia sp.]